MFRNRSYQKELIDDLEVFGPDLIQNLKELHSINDLLGGYSISKSGFKSFVKQFPAASLTIVDAGCGGGDFLNRFYRWAQKQGKKVNLVGLDANQNILDYAKDRTKKTQGISLIKQNILEPWAQGIKPDLVHFSLFLHRHGAKSPAPDGRKRRIADDPNLPRQPQGHPMVQRHGCGQGRAGIIRIVSGQ